MSKTAKATAPVAAVQVPEERQTTGAFGYEFEYARSKLASQKDEIIRAKDSEIEELQALNKELSHHLRVTKMRLAEFGIQPQALRTQPSPAVRVPLVQPNIKPCSVAIPREPWLAIPPPVQESFKSGKDLITCIGNRVFVTDVPKRIGRQRDVERAIVKRTNELARREKKREESKEIRCEICNKVFANIHSLRSHRSKVHAPGGPTKKCKACKKDVARSYWYSTCPATKKNHIEEEK